jgi:hypothetical protein
MLLSEDKPGQGYQGTQAFISKGRRDIDLNGLHGTKVTVRTAKAVISLTLAPLSLAAGEKRFATCQRRASLDNGIVQPV